MMTCKLKYLGVSAFEFVDNSSRKYYIDPCLDDSPTPVMHASDIKEAAAVIVTHGAKDHMGQAIEILQQTDATLISASDVATHALRSGIPQERIRRIVYGAKREIADLSIKAVKAEHISFFKSYDIYLSGTPLGYILEFVGGKKIYHAGDTAIFSDMKLIGELNKPEIALIPIGMFPGAVVEMDPEEAALAVSWIKPKIVVPMHYDPVAQADFPVLFKNFLKEKAPEVQVIDLKPGEEMDISK